jgi:hypothetical protein
MEISNVVGALYFLTIATTASLLTRFVEPDEVSAYCPSAVYPTVITGRQNSARHEYHEQFGEHLSNVHIAICVFMVAELVDYSCDGNRLQAVLSLDFKAQCVHPMRHCHHHLRFPGFVYLFGAFTVCICVLIIVYIDRLMVAAEKQ